MADNRLQKCDRPINRLLPIIAQKLYRYRNRPIYKKSLDRSYTKGARKKDTEVGEEGGLLFTCSEARQGAAGRNWSPLLNGALRAQEDIET